MSSIDEELERMRAAHRAIARYRVYLHDPMKKRGKQITEIERDLTWDQANEKRDRLNAELAAKGERRFMDSMYGVELTNSWDCMTPQARGRQLALGKKEADFRV